MRIRAFVDVVIVTVATAATVGFAVFAFRSHDVDSVMGAEITDVADQPTKVLLSSPRTEAVCREILNREGVDPHSLNAALIRLSILARKTQPAILCELLRSLSADSTDALVKNLCLLVDMLPETSQPEIAASAETLLTAPESPSTARRAAYAVWLSTSPHPNEVFDCAAHADDTLLFVTSLPLVHSQERRVRLYDCLQPILNNADSISESHTTDLSSSENMKTLQAAIEVCVQLEGRMSEKAADLIGLLHHSQLKRVVFKSLVKIPAKRLPQEQLGYVASEVVSFIAEHSPVDRRQEDIQNARVLAKQIGDRMIPEKQARLSKRLAELFDD